MAENPIDYLATPEFQQLYSMSQMLTSISTEIIIIDKESLGIGNDMLEKVKGMRKKIALYFKPLKEQARNLHKDLCAKEGTLDEPYERAETLLRDKITKYVVEAQRIAEEEAARLKKQQEEQILAMAIEEEGKGNQAASELLLSSSLNAPSVSVPLPTNLSTRQVLVVEVTNVLSLIESITNALLPADVIEVNNTVLRKIVQRVGMDTFNTIPGVRAYYKSSLVSRGKEG